MSFVMASCSDTPPPGATLAPDPKKYTGGTCPALVSGHNPFPSGSATRDFRLVLPADIKPEERFPVLFLWHWLGGSADDFYAKGQIPLAADTQRFIAVIPESKGDLFKWPFEVSQTQARMDEEFTFFDDMLACVSDGDLALRLVEACDADWQYADAFIDSAADYVESVGRSAIPVLERITRVRSRAPA